MNPETFTPTEEQSRIIRHDGSAFVSACPGAGKTRVLVERARSMLREDAAGKGVAFLSFTNAATFELDLRLRREGLLPSPPFPHFVGTFDSFLWMFLVAPFGVPGCPARPRLIPDLGERTVRPWDGVPELPLKYFDRYTGEILPTEARSRGFNPSKNHRVTTAYMSSAASARQRFFARGELDFEDVRTLAASHLRDAASASRLAAALSGRFREVVVDEAQDCNRLDLETIQWLRDAGIATKVICDPQQSIYGFRGGVAEELIVFGRRFAENDRLPMSGNFRSSEPICKAISTLRPRDAPYRPDRALGKSAAVSTPVYLLSYRGNGVAASIGAAFRELVVTEGFDLSLCPVLAATRDSSRKAIGQPGEVRTTDCTLRLANAVTAFHFSFEAGNRREALDDVHRVVLEIGDRMGTKTYRQYLSDEGLEPGRWRPAVLKVVRELRYDISVYPDPDTWLALARTLLEPHLPDHRRSINQVLRRNAGLADALATAPTSNPPAKTIHSVKGMEFLAVCVVMTVPTTKGILDYLETGTPVESSEDARKIYVGASRAQRLLAIATPNGQAGRLKALLVAGNAFVEVLDL